MSARRKSKWTPTKRTLKIRCKKSVICQNVSNIVFFISIHSYFPQFLICRRVNLDETLGLVLYGHWPKLAILFVQFVIFENFIFPLLYTFMKLQSEKINSQVCELNIFSFDLKSCSGRLIVIVESSKPGDDELFLLADVAGALKELVPISVMNTPVSDTRQGRAARESKPLKNNHSSHLSQYFRVLF